MSPSRRERQHATNRENILLAAQRLAEREGWGAVTIRRIAQEIDYTSPIIYQHFANKDAALQALMEQGFAQLHARMEQAARSATPEERPTALGRAYLAFAREQTRLYELMNGLSGVVLDVQARQQAAGGVTALTTDVLQTWADEQGATLGDPVEACEMAWGVLHGMATLGFLPAIGFQRAEQLALRAMHALLQAWKEAR
ncbi:TetR/AcrR family transcriptional regulator [Deinococcus maricopensis]|uniref:Regulatory protein TetR n=1 Tax=Deinococcus maricopensis (strain DSM 21211 / LMG 22137 / NRRL B-23946 / LB-34) TaxID=709986 RepID=E8U3Y1_DEIML|nr:TetR/AcrR family transcriptional regulator [Deinococcus maricopensis]ADV65675.1 regulatory protein TetR [Deinococcus maricopensis DSM 21211]